MQNINNDLDYNELVSDILSNSSFNVIKNTEHHGVSRYEHSLKVSYYSYKIAKKLHLSYEDVARGGLLHDFFISPNERTSKERFISTFNHPKKAVKNSITIFNINDKQKDIIHGHMFPFYIAIPKSLESWIVNIVDKVVGFNEFRKKYQSKFSYVVNLYLILFINFMR